MTTPLSRPQTMKFQLAPCHRPVTNQSSMVHRYTDTRLPASPRRARAFWWSFRTVLLTDRG